MNENGVIPLIRYRDVTQAVHWLTNCFGFKAYNLVKNSDGTITYAELSYGRGVLMVGPVGHSALDDILKQPHEINGINTQCCYVALQDIDSHYHQSCQAGVEIVLDLKEHDNCERTYVARDIEGHLWNFGTYTPWKKWVMPIHKNDQNSNSFHEQRNKYTFPIVLFSLVALLVYSSFTLVNSYLTATKSSEVFQTPVINTDVQSKLSNMESISQNSDKNSISALENYKDKLSNEKQTEEKLSAKQVLFSPIISPDEETLNRDEPYKQKTVSQTDVSPASQEVLTSKGEKQYVDLSSRKNLTTEKNNQLFLTNSRDSRDSGTPSSIEVSPKTGSIGEQSQEDPTISPEEPLPPVTVTRVVPSQIKTPKMKQSVDHRKGKAKTLTPKMTPASTKKKNSPSTEKTLFYLFN